ncbi:PAS fold family [Synechococcus sp. PCC 7335]|nr:PAS fold family [Synechococcus sp. PCC 7335]
MAYFSIPLTLIYFIRQRQQDFPTSLTLLFGSFIFLCGFGHLIDIATLWFPIYWISGIVKALTALVSCYTAMELVVLLPQFLALRESQKKEAAAQKALEKSRQVFRDAFHDAPIGVALVSLVGKFLKVNKSTAQITGYSEEELCAVDFQSITHPDDLQEDLDLVDQLMQGSRRLYQLEKRYFHKSGHIVYVRISVSLLRDANGDPQFFVAHIEDVSEQHRVNAALKAAQQEAEVASKSKSSFLAMMSHEIRTPMNALLGMAELLESTALTVQQKEFVSIIRSSGKTLLTIINDILDFSKVESGNLVLEEGYLDLYECIEDVLILFSNQADEKSLMLSSLVEPATMPTVFTGDPVRMRQILSNLISNSIKFTKKGEISIHVTISPIEAEALSEKRSYYQLQFAVKDTGIGIPKHKLDKLFKPFSQVDSSVTRKHGGTGLGLSICKRLVELMGGQMWVESELGCSSTFHFSIQLPAYENACQTPNLQAHGLSQKNLLIITSNQTNLAHLALQAESWGLNVSQAASPEAALVELRAKPRFDIVAIQKPLHGLGLMEMALRIRELPGYQIVPLIVMKSRKHTHTTPVDSLKGNVAVLRKPVRRSQFYNALVRLLVDKKPFATDSTTLPEQPKTESTISIQNPLRILLAEDIALNQKVALYMITSFGYQADVANNGKEAVEALQSHAYDLVLMDVQMPEMDGLEATRIIRANSNIVQPHIVAMTAHALQGDREECLSAGMNGYIRKPITKDELLKTLQQCPQLDKTLETLSSRDLASPLQ